MSKIAGLQDFRQEGPPADIGTFVSPSTAIVYHFTFSGATYTCAMGVGAGAWTLIAYSVAGDDHVEINAALNYVRALGGGQVKLAQGDFYPTEAIRIFDNIWFDGSGRDTVIHVPSDPVTYGAGNWFIMNDDQMLGNTGITFSNLALDGNKDSYSEAKDSCFWTGVTDSFFYNIWGYDHISCLLCYTWCARCNISDVFSWNQGLEDSAGWGVVYDHCSYMLLEGLIHHTSNRGAVALSASWYCTVKHCIAHTCQGGGIYVTDGMPVEAPEDSYDNLIEGCQCLNNGGYGIVIVSLLGGDMYRTRLFDNILIDNTLGKVFDGGIDTTGEMMDVFIGQFPHIGALTTPGTAYTEGIQAGVRTRIDYDKLNVFKGRIVVFGRGDENNDPAVKGVRIYNITDGAAIATVEWIDNAYLLRTGDWTSYDNAGDDEIGIQFKGSSVTEDLELYSIHYQLMSA